MQALDEIQFPSGTSETSMKKRPAFLSQTQSLSSSFTNRSEVDSETSSRDTVLNSQLSYQTLTPRRVNFCRIPLINKNHLQLLMTSPFRKTYVQSLREDLLSAGSPLLKEETIQHRKSTRYYQGLVCSVLAKSLYAIEDDGPLREQLEKIILFEISLEDQCQSWTSEKVFNQLKRYLKPHVFRWFQYRKNGKPYDYLKMSNLTIHRENDSRGVCLNKRIFRKMLDFFVQSDGFDEWVRSRSLEVKYTIFRKENKQKLLRKLLS